MFMREGQIARIASLVADHHLYVVQPIADGFGVEVKLAASDRVGNQTAAASRTRGQGFRSNCSNCDG